MRLVSKEVNNVLETNRNSPTNFGLYFNKMLNYNESKGIIEPSVKQDKRSLIEQYKKGGGVLARGNLDQRHTQQAQYCQAMKRMGWTPIIVSTKLTSTFISGLGMTHPTETGLVLDHLSGMPYIPASSQKGVLRLAHLINTLHDDEGNWLSEEKLLEMKIVTQSREGELIWHEETSSRALFGTSTGKEALAGQLILLDAYPLEPPSLVEEILNPHFGDYYAGKSGPTEDQAPVPVKFLAVKSGAEFVFRILLRPPLAKSEERDREKLVNLTEKSLNRALTEEGIGAKTSVGFGLFKILGKGEPETVLSQLEVLKTEQENKKYPWRREIPKIESIDNWGELVSKVFESSIKSHKDEAEVGGIVKKIALRVKNKSPKKWDSARDKKIKEWLNTSGTEWKIDTQEKTLHHSKEENEIIQRIENLRDWGHFKSETIKITPLSITTARTLEKKFKQWACDNKKAKEGKKSAWKELQKRIKDEEP